jgi:hypothetical protein
VHAIVQARRRQWLYPLYRFFEIKRCHLAQKTPRDDIRHWSSSGVPSPCATMRIPRITNCAGPVQSPDT